MARPNLGSKRVCPLCNTRFYDLGKDPATCPECGAGHRQASFLKPRRARPPAPRAAPGRPAPKDKNEDGLALDDDEDEDDGDVEELDEDNGLGEVVAGGAGKDSEEDS